ncbi:MAG: DUF480 domain-containing protein [Candidatus Eisenbacteria bacterium]|uniref:DUF480 domain-containing protein n=1 Tax=Eiseniibacteriota bacterium TaxID=2212470 RepID=A0A933SDX3_UNCEI|nr:DUF480 domain-containing protein [Candidatus Eisenbacteria bacterium]
MTSPDSPARFRPLDPNQRRVLGVLIEKAMTTPAGYPMTVNAIVTGCNQKNNRDPITTLDDIDVGNALVELAEMGAVAEIDWMGRSSKYKHKAYEWLGVTKAELAVMGELLLRGAQQLGELRARADRMEAIADLAALKPIVEGLVARGLMIELTPPGRGQMVTHGLGLPGEVPAMSDHAAEHAAAPVARAAAPAATDEVAELRAELARLTERVARLEARLPVEPGEDSGARG